VGGGGEEASARMERKTGRARQRGRRGEDAERSARKEVERCGGGDAAEEKWRKRRSATAGEAALRRRSGRRRRGRRTWEGGGGSGPVGFKPGRCGWPVGRKVGSTVRSAVTARWGLSMLPIPSRLLSFALEHTLFFLLTR
jgi:hypothetical protein